MNKFLTAIILSAFLLVGNSFCSASMPRNEMYLGGLTFGSSTVQFLKMYGKPTKTEGGIEHMYDCHYGDSVSIGYNAYTNKIFEIIVTENNGWNTPKGLAVGMTIDKALELYGESDFVQSGADKTVYAYFHSNGKENDFCFIILADDATGKILKMEITGSNPMVTLEDFFQSHVDRMLGIEEHFED